MFNSPQTGDYSLQQSSPAITLGFNTNDVPLVP
jgi:hypothetical protein